MSHARALTSVESDTPTGARGLSCCQTTCVGTTASHDHDDCWEGKKMILPEHKHFGTDGRGLD